MPGPPKGSGAKNQRWEVCILTMPVWLTIVLILAALAAGALIGFMYRKNVGEREIGSAEEEAKRILNDAIKRRNTQKPLGIRA